MKIEFYNTENGKVYCGCDNLNDTNKLMEKAELIAHDNNCEVAYRFVYPKYSLKASLRYISCKNKILISNIIRLLRRNKVKNHKFLFIEENIFAIIVLMLLFTGIFIGVFIGKWIA